MITRADIRQETNSASYSRGLQLWRSGSVRKMDVEEKEQIPGATEMEIRAEVLGSTGNFYQVQIAVDEKGGEILSDTCNCPAHEKYWGLCKHCVAVMMEYIDWRKARRAEKEQKAGKDDAEGLKNLESLLGEMGVKKGTGEIIAPAPEKKVKPRSVKTSPGLAELMASYAMRDKALYLPDAKNGQVKLEANIQLQYQGIQAEFRIGIGRMYVLKSISQFAAAVLNLDQVSYGVNLSFLHCMEAFTPECRPLVRHLIEQSREKNRMYQTPYGKWYSYESDRYLAIESWTIDSFMEALEQVEFTLETMSRKAKKGQLQDGTPPLGLQLSGDQNAMQLKVPEFTFFEGRDCTYFFKGATIYRAKNEELSGIMVFFRYLQERRENSCTIAEDDYPVFCQNLLPALERLFKVKKTLPELAQYLPPEVKFHIYLDLPEKGTVTCGLYSVYGEQKFNVFKDINSIWQMSRGRDVQKEMAVYSRIMPYCTAYDGIREEMVIQGEDAVYEFLTKGM